MKSNGSKNLRTDEELTNKSGFTAVECAFMALVLLFVTLGTVEFVRIAMFQHNLTDAARVAARQASLPTIDSASTVEANLRDQLSSSISAARDDRTVSISVRPRDFSTLSSGDSVRVQVVMNYSDVSWIPFPTLVNDRILSAAATQERE